MKNIKYWYLCRSCGVLQDRCPKGHCWACQSEDVWPLATLLRDPEPLRFPICPRQGELRVKELREETMQKQAQLYTEAQRYTIDRNPALFLTAPDRTT